MRVDVVLAPCRESLVEFCKAGDTRDGNKYISSSPTDEVFHKSFLVAIACIAEDGFETVMSCQCCI